MPDNSSVQELEDVSASAPPTYSEYLNDSNEGAYDNLEDAPPAYGDSFDHLQFSKPGFGAYAGISSKSIIFVSIVWRIRHECFSQRDPTINNVLDEGRVNVEINGKARHLARILGPFIHEAPSGNEDTSDSNSIANNLPIVDDGESAVPKQPQAPPPALNVVIQVVGSRGDVQPFLALGKFLKKEFGHRVRVATHGNFKNFVEDEGLEFYNIGGNPLDLMAFMVKHPGLMPSFSALKSGEVTKRRKDIADILEGCWRSCIESGNGMPQHKRSSSSAGDDTAGSIDNESSASNDSNNTPFVADTIIANPPSFAHIHLAEKLGIPVHIMFT